jgi:hypothetical protein
MSIQVDFRKVLDTLHSCTIEEQVISTDRMFNNFLSKYFSQVEAMPILIVTPRAERDTFIQIYNYEKDLMYGKIYKHELVEA